jgi:hypothetical protein
MCIASSGVLESGEEVGGIVILSGSGVVSGVQHGYCGEKERNRSRLSQ